MVPLLVRDGRPTILDPSNGPLTTMAGRQYAWRHVLLPPHPVIVRAQRLATPRRPPSGPVKISMADTSAVPVPAPVQIALLMAAASVKPKKPGTASTSDLLQDFRQLPAPKTLSSRFTWTNAPKQMLETTAELPRIRL